MKGERITNPLDIFGQKSVYIELWHRPCAVAFIISMQFKEVKSLFDRGVYYYTPKEKTKFKPYSGGELIKSNY